MPRDAERGRAPDSSSPLLLVRLVGLALLLWAFSTEVRPTAAGPHVAAWALAASEVPAWVAWSVGGGGSLRRLVTFGWLGAVGGVLGVFAPAALAFVGSAGLGAGTGLDLSAALGVSAVGPTAALVAAAIAGRSLTWVLASGAVALAGVVVGMGRRQATKQVAQAAQVALEHERAEVAQARADVFAERNRLAREVHDVLATPLERSLSSSRRSPRPSTTTPPPRPASPTGSVAPAGSPSTGWPRLGGPSRRCTTTRCRSPHSWGACERHGAPGCTSRASRARSAPRRPSPSPGSSRSPSPTRPSTRREPR